MDTYNQYLSDRDRSLSYHEYLRDMMGRVREDAEKSNMPSAASAQKLYATSLDSEVVSVNFFEIANARAHHTDKFALVHNPNASLIIRRGQPFKMAVNFKEDYNPDEDKITLEFSFGHEPSVYKGSQVFLEVKNKQNFTRRPVQWDVKVDAIKGREIKLQVQVPSTIGIGVWSFSTLLRSKTRHTTPKRRKFDKNIYILFNPWCKGDTVYMEKEDWKNEYILNDVGKMYHGSPADIRVFPWVYGQFSVVTLPAAMYILDLSRLPYNARANSVRVARMITQMMNKSTTIPGDKGVMVPKWGHSKEEYGGGTKPWSWTGSAPIFEEFLKTGGTPVKYGQCWVFTGLTTAVCRAVGIPSRSVTCYSAGHDDDETLTINVFYDSELNPLSSSRDSVWNFHVWTEVWMTRWDLPAGYGGWQAIDGTPQVLSEGNYQMGPCSVLGVKRGEVGLLYNTIFVFSEVNADMVNWKMRKDERGFDKMMVKNSYIGKLVVTKKVGCFDNRGVKDMEDITSSYKYKEDTPEERIAVMKASRHAGRKQLFDMPDPEQGEIRFQLVPVRNVMVGENFKMAVLIENWGRQNRSVEMVLRCCAVYYTGIIASKIKEEKTTVFISTDRDVKNETSWTVEASDYLDHLVEFANIKIYYLAMVQTTNQAWAGEQDFVFNKPKLLLELPNHLRVGNEYNLRVTFKNPYKKTLSECQFNAEGPGLIESNQRDFRDIKGNETVTQQFPITPYYKCQTVIVAVFSSKELSEITGSKTIRVTK